MVPPPAFRPDSLRRCFEQALPLLDLLPDVLVFAKDQHHRFVLANEAEWRMQGCTCEAEMLGRTDHHFHPPALAQRYIEEDLQVMRRGEAILHQVWLVPHAEGTPFWYVCSKLPLRDAQQKVVGIAGLMRPYERAGSAPEEYRRLLPALQFASQHFAEPLAVSQLAVQAGLSTSQFQREFRRVFNMTPGAYLTQVRLQAARHLLAHSPQPLSAIALDCGFHDQSHFTKRFQAATGLGPRAYRRRFAPSPGQHRPPLTGAACPPPRTTHTAPT